MLTYKSTLEIRIDGNLIASGVEVPEGKDELTACTVFLKAYSKEHPEVLSKDVGAKEGELQEISKVTVEAVSEEK